jgi:hypothetical protein
MFLETLYQDAARRRTSFVDRLKAGGDSSPATALAPANASANLNAALGYNPTLVSHGRQYEHGNTGWPYAAIRAIAQRVAGQEIRVGRWVGKHQQGRSRQGIKRPRLDRLPRTLKDLREDLEVFDNHPLLEAVNDPNALMVRWALLFVTAASLEITGKSYWWFFNERKDRAGKWSILPVPASWITPRHAEGKLYAEWEIRSSQNARPVIVPGDEVAYIYYPDPANPLSALSPLQAQAKAVVADEAMTEAQRRAFSQGLWPGVAITMGRNPGVNNQPGNRPILTEHQRAQIINAVKQAYQGVVRNEEPIILDGWIEAVSRISNSPREMDFTRSGQYTKERITQGFGVNPIVMGQVEGANRASAVAAEEHFCFAPETRILTVKGVKSIRDVVPGDRVLTHQGRWRTVLHTMRRPYAGIMRRLRFRGGGAPVLATPAHPFLVGNEWVPALHLRPRQGRRGADACVWPGWTGKGWVQETSIRVAAYRGGYHGGCWNEHRFVPDMAFARFLGLYAAEGCPSVGGLSFNVHEKEEEDVFDIITAAVKPLMNLRPYVSQHRGHGIQVNQSGEGLASWVVEAIGKGAVAKRVPPVLYDWPTSLRRAFLAGYLGGDGHERKEYPGQRGGCGFSTVSPHLAHGVRQLIRDLGFRVGVRCYQIARLPVICGKQVKSARPVYSATVHGYARQEVINTHGPGRTDISVMENAEVEYVGDVYNLEVAADNSYTLAAGPVVHNCNGTVNPKIELISQCLTAWAGPIFAAPGERLYVWIEPAQVIDPDLQMSRLKVMMGYGAVTVNEVRAEMGWSPVPGGDVAYVPNTVTAVDLSKKRDPAAEQAPANPPAQDGGTGGADGVPVPDPQAA